MVVRRSEAVRSRTGISGRPGAGKKVVTGAAGFIGSHLCEALTQLGHEVVGIDCLDDYYDPALKRANLEALRDEPRFTFAETDLCSSGLGRLLGGCDTLFHLAGRPGVQSSWGPGFAASVRSNVLASVAVFAWSRTAGVPRVVVASSSSVYGNEAANLGSSRVAHPTSPYGATKLAVEGLAGLYRRRGLDVRCLRYFTVYGPRQRPDMAISRILDATSLDGHPFVIAGSGEQARDFTFVDDVVEATVRAGEVDRFADRPLDVGAGTPIELNTVVELAEEVTGRRVRRLHTTRPPGDPDATFAQVSEAERVLEWRARVDIATGMRRQWEWQAAARRSGRDRSTAVGSDAVRVA